MRLGIARREIDCLVAKQLDNLFMLRKAERALLKRAIAGALERAEYCFARTDNKYYRKDGAPYFNPFHSGQYCIFLYFLSRELVAKDGPESLLADRVYYLNKALNGLDLYHAVEMPRVFMLDHPVGSVLGRARYGEFFSFTQNCTVGNNHDLYPTFGRNVSLMSGAKVAGRCIVGDDVIIAANAFVKDTDIPPRSIVFGSSPNLVIKPLASIGRGPARSAPGGRR
jgi:serine O-acetyltransferase